MENFAKSMIIFPLSLSNVVYGNMKIMQVDLDQNNI